MSNLEKWGKKLQNIPRIYIGIMTIIIVAIPLIYPLNLPVVVTSDVQNLYDTINTLPNGAVVVFTHDSGTWQWIRTAAATIACLNLLMTRPVKIIMWSLFPDGQALFPLLMSYIKIPQDKVYGRDWVYFGYVAGQEVALSQLAVNLHTPKYDYYGNLINDLPIMKNVNSYRDVTLLIQNGASGEISTMYVRQWSSPYLIPMAIIQTPVNVIMNLPYRAAGQIKWVVWSNVGGAELESLLGYKGWGYSDTDAQNMIHIVLIAMLIIGNVGYQLEILGKKKKRRDKIMVTLEIVIPAIMTVMVLTFMYKENPIYRLAEYIMVSSACSVLLVTALNNIYGGGITKIMSGDYIYIIGIVLGIFLYTKFIKKYDWLSRFSISFLATVSFGVAITGALRASIIDQIIATAKLPIINVPFDTAISNIITIVIFLTALLYFTYTIWGEKSTLNKGYVSSIFGVTSKIGRYSLMIAFGTILGNMVMDRFTSLIDTMRTLLRAFGLAAF